MHHLLLAPNTLVTLISHLTDLYLIHWPYAFERAELGHTNSTHSKWFPDRYDDVSTIETWRELERAVADGLVRAIGLSNFNMTQIEALLEQAAIRPAVLQIESHLWFPNTEIIRYAQRRGIVVTAYSPLGSGRADSEGHTIPGHPLLTAVGAANNRSAAQVALAWQLGRGVVAVPMSVTPQRLRENLLSWFHLTSDEVTQLGKLDSGTRLQWGGELVLKRGKWQPRDVSHPMYPWYVEHSFFTHPKALFKHIREPLLHIRTPITSFFNYSNYSILVTNAHPLHHIHTAYHHMHSLRHHILILYHHMRTAHIHTLHLHMRTLYPHMHTLCMARHFITPLNPLVTPLGQGWMGLSKVNRQRALMLLERCALAICRVWHARCSSLLPLARSSCVIAL